jgi:hypothetical protein
MHYTLQHLQLSAVLHRDLAAWTPHVPVQPHLVHQALHSVHTGTNSADVYLVGAYCTVCASWPSDCKEMMRFHTTYSGCFDCLV